jgi:hypothetical protein
MNELSDRVFAIHPTTTGFGWVLLSGPHNPLDWGTANIPDRSVKSLLARLELLLVRNVPTDLVLEDADAEGSRRNARIRRLCRKMIELGRKKGIKTAVYPHSEIVATFVPEEARTRYEIAVAITKRIPDFEHLLPPKRKIWLPEDPRMGLFDATAVGITHYRVTKHR